MAKRKRVLVDPAVQWALGRRVILHWVLFLACLLSVNTFLHIVVSIADTGLWESMRAGLYAQIPVIGVMLVLMPIFVRDTLKLSNRFAGPMFRLRSCISKLARGQESRPVNFRSGDFWQEVADEFNSLRERVEYLEKRNQELDHQVRDSQVSEPVGV